MKTIGLVFIGFVAIAAAWFAYDPMQTSVIHWVAAGVCLAALVGIIIILAAGRQPRPKETKPKSKGNDDGNGEDEGDWLAKIYAIGDRMRWPRPTTRPTASLAKPKKKYGWVILQTVFVIIAVADVVATHGWFSFYWLAPLLVLVIQGVKNGNTILGQFLIFGGPIFSGSIKLLWAGIWGIMTLAKFL